MKILKKINIDCDKATTICNKSQYGEARFFEVIQMKWHRLRCKVCILYGEQNTKMTELFRLKSKDCRNHINSLSTADKSKLKKEFNKQKDK